MKSKSSQGVSCLELFWLVMCGFFVFGAAGIIIFIGYAPPTEHVWSNVILFDTGWRYSQGLIPHLDTHSSFGFVFHALVGWSMKLFGSHPDAIGYLPLLVLPFLVIWSWLVGRDRLPPWLNAAFTAAVIAHLLAISMYGSEGSQGITYAGQYNRISWAMIMPLLLFLSLPYTGDRRGAFQVTMLVLAGVWTGLLFGIKFTIIAGIVGAIVCGVVVRICRQQKSWLKETVIDVAIVLVAAIISLTVFGMVIGSSAAAYMSDLALLASGTQDSLFKLMFLAVRETRILPVAVWMVAVYACVIIRPWSWQHTGGVILVAIISCGAGFILSATNGGELASPCYLMSVWILLGHIFQMENLEINTENNQVHTGLFESLRSPTVRNVAIFLVVSFNAVTIASLARPVVNVAWAHIRLGPWQPSWGIDTDNMSDAWMSLNGPLPAGLDELESGMSPTPETYRASLYALRLRAGMELIGDNLDPETRITTLDFVNPFPFMTGTGSIRGDILYWHYARNVGSEMIFDATDVVAQADIIMEPQRPIVPDTTELKRSMFHAHFPQDFYQAGENEWWIIWRKKDS